MLLLVVWVNLKKIADAASKMTKIEKAAEAAKATRLAQKAAEAGALASKWHKVKTAVATQGRNIGASMKESKIAEDMIKDTLSGGLNNVMGYYMDDTVKDKSVMGGHRDVYFWCRSFCNRFSV